MDKINIKPIEDDDVYRYIGTNKNISYVGSLTKERRFNLREENLAIRT